MYIPKEPRHLRVISGTDEVTGTFIMWQIPSATVVDYIKFKAPNGATSIVSLDDTELTALELKGSLQFGVITAIKLTSGSMVVWN